jgi:Protein of unknown function (DUF3891)
MFKSKRRPIAIPQSEHLKLAGALAHAWGNADFDSPPFEHLSLVAGVGLHDRGYGFLDNDVILEIPEERWLVIARRGFDMLGSDPVADLIARYHFRRLARNNPSAAVQALYHAFAQEIEEQLREHGLSATLFERIDRITNLCDSISFNFCFEEPAQGQVAVFTRNGDDTEVSVQYDVAPDLITVDPWPFSLESLTGYIIAYRLPDYPARLDPVILPYMLSRKI